MIIFAINDYYYYYYYYVQIRHGRKQFSSRASVTRVPALCSSSSPREWIFYAGSTSIRVLPSDHCVLDLFCHPMWHLRPFRIRVVVLICESKILGSTGPRAVLHAYRVFRECSIFLPEHRSYSRACFHFGLFSLCTRIQTASSRVRAVIVTNVH